MLTQLPENFDPGNQEGNSWDLLPDGDYVAQVIEAAVQQPKSGDGYHVALVWRICEGPYENRQVWQRITYIHSSEQAQTIGRKTLKDLTVACGIADHVEDVAVFLFKPCRVKIGVEKDKDGIYDDKNRIKRILSLEQVPVTATPKSATPQAEANKSAAKPVLKAAPRPAGTAPWHQG